MWRPKKCCFMFSWVVYVFLSQSHSNSVLISQITAHTEPPVNNRLLSPEGEPFTLSVCTSVIGLFADT